MTPTKFRAMVWRYYRAHGRHELPWRPPTLKLRRGKENDFVYKILVSEVMLQQTQVERVVPFYNKFTKQFPTARRLSAAPLSEVLKAWQGLGYNRRAKMLHAAAQKLQKLLNLAYRPKQGVNDVVRELEKLPGVGRYTARAVATFAYNQDVIFVETNIRTAIVHHFFAGKKKISDSEIEKVLAQTLPKGKALLRQGYEGRAREWYSALMDYGAYLKSIGISHNAWSLKYVKQSRFAGSLREARGALLRAYTRGITSRARLTNLLGPSRRAQMKGALAALTKEGLIESL